MKYLITTVLIAALSISTAVMARGGHAPGPVVNLGSTTCDLPRLEILGEEDAVVGFENTRVADCPAVFEPREEEGTYRAWASATRARPGNAGVGPTNVSFDSDDYDDIPCVIKGSLFQYYISYDWKTTISAVPGGTVHNITCRLAEEVEEEDIKALGITVE